MLRPMIAIAALPLLLVACGGETSKVYTDAEGNTVEVTESSADGENVDVNIKSKDGTMNIKGGASADANVKMPFDLPKIAGSTVAAHMTANTADGENGAMVTLQSNQSAEDAFAFYKKALTDGGFSIEGEMTANETRMITAKRGEKDGVLVTITPGEGGESGNFNIMIAAGGQ